MSELSIRDVVQRYDAVLLDSYGVLVDGAGALPGAAELVTRLQAEQRPWLVVSNDASRSVAASAARYVGLGLPIPADRILLSAALIAPHFRAHGLVGARCIVLGPDDSIAWVRDAGGEIAAWDDAQPDAVVVCDDAGYPFVDAVEAVISTLATRLAAGLPVALVLPNPDLVYPAGAGRLALTAGSAATVIESALAAVLGPAAPRFVGLGKPHAPIFDEACRRLGIAPADRGRAVMLGDQLLTDIAGARAAGLSAGLLRTGVTTVVPTPGSEHAPTFVLDSLLG